MSDLEKAREWAEEYRSSKPYPPLEAANNIILSLPDQWVDAGKVREVTDRHNDLIVDFLDQLVGDMHTDTWEAIRDFMCELNVEVGALLTPKLPTLADMTQEEREACQWMQAQTWHEVGIIVSVDEMTEIAQLITRANGVLERKFKDITPLPDLPKLKLPGSEPESTHFDNLPDEAKQVIKESIEEYKAGQFVDFDSSPCPEDVPPNEPWLIEVDGQKAIGTRHKEDVHVPWSVAALDGSFTGDYDDREVTLIHKLVPENYTLPEGMRLADHEKYGRVVVAPKPDRYGCYEVLHCTSEQAGTNWEYISGSELIFLDGEQ